LARRCRESGIPVSVDGGVLLARALSVIDCARLEDVYWACRTVLTSDPAHARAFDEAFHEVFGVGGGLVSGEVEIGQPGSDPSADAVQAEGPAGGADVAEVGVALVDAASEEGHSASESLRQRDFADCDPDELAEARALLASLHVHRPTRTSRRGVRSRRGSIDLRRTLQGSLRTGGEVMRLARTRPGRRPRRLVLLCDVSGSMAPYSRELLRFLHVVTASARDVEAFTVGTRLTRITRQLRTTDPDAALGAAAQEVRDWSGGTRLGEGIREVNDRWAGTAARGAVVVVLSDGWDCGDPAVLDREMARLGRVAQRVVWVNPLRASDGYQPLAAGMAAALPHVDDFVDGHSVAALERLVELLA
jgi:hypothetical protein